MINKQANSQVLPALKGLGSAVPHVVPQSAAADHAKRFCCETKVQEAVLDRLYRQAEVLSRASAVAERLPDGRVHDRFFSSKNGPLDKGPGTSARMDAYREHSLKLAVESAGKALRAAEIVPERVTHLVTVSCTGFGAPGTDIGLINSLGMSRRVERVNVGFMGCHGAINGLRVCAGLCASDPQAVAVLCATELCSLHFQYDYSSDALVANSLFSDGSAAAVLANSGDGKDLSLVGSGSYILPDSLDLMQWKVGDHGFTMTLSSDLPGQIKRHLTEWFVEWLAEKDLSIADIGSWAIHPGGPRILDAVKECLGLNEHDMEASRSILRDYGNISSPTVLFILERILRLGCPRPVVLLAFGPGVTAEALLLI